MLSLSYASESVQFNSVAPSCDCLAHVYGNAADHPDRVRRYPSDMTDEEWAVVRDAMPVPAWLEGRGGQPEGYCHRVMLDAIRYVTDNGIKWRAMPVYFPPWDRVYAFFRRWRDHALVREFHDRLRSKVRENLGRDAEPSAGVIDSQSVKADGVVGADSRGFDGGKLVNARKRHVADTHHQLELVWADGGYTGGLVEHCLATLALALAIVKRSDDTRGFVVLPKRWIVERFFAHLMRTRRLARDFERRTTSAEAMVYWSMTLLMTRRLARPGPGPG